MLNEFLGVKLIDHDNSEWRRVRLIKALCTMYDNNFFNINPINKIESVEDHEGQLSVIWKNPPLLEELQIVTFAWEDCGEHEVYNYIIRHEIYPNTR
jgi:hypothetical protein